MSNGITGILADVAVFHRAADVPVQQILGFPATKNRERRRRLLNEEFSEYCEAEDTNDLVEVADALADMIYVIAGTALEYGIPLDRVWSEVQSSNMAKIDPNTGKCKKRDDGKILKPVGWQPPNIAKVLFSE